MMKKGMSTKDKELHQLIKTKVKEFQPKFNEKHWESLEFKLIRQNKNSLLLRRGGLFLVTLFIVVSLFYFLSFQKTTTEIVSEGDSSFISISRTPLNKTKEKEISFQDNQENEKTKQIINQPIYQTQLHRNSSTIKPILALSFKQANLTPPKKGVTLDMKLVQQFFFNTVSPSTKKVEKLPSISFLKQNIKPSPNTNIDYHWRYSRLEKQIIELKQQISGNSIISDSTTFKVFDRKKDDWKNIVVVCDWTSSMHVYGAQVLVWLNKNINNPNIKGFVFFNDCDSTGAPLGLRPKLKGAMYSTHSRDKTEIQNIMIQAMQYEEENFDIIENDFEAVLYAINQFPEAENIVLIADNKSGVRNEKLLDKIQKPIRIISCGVKQKIDQQDSAIQSIYLSLAYQTNGSIHTLDADIEHFERIQEGEFLTINQFKYILKKNKFKLKK